MSELKNEIQVLKQSNIDMVKLLTSDRGNAARKVSENYQTAITHPTNLDDSIDSDSSADTVVDVEHRGPPLPKNGKHDEWNTTSYKKPKKPKRKEEAIQNKAELKDNNLKYHNCLCPKESDKIIRGLHLFYLERDAHAFLTWSTLGGYGLGWLADITKIPRYVRDCNDDPKFLGELGERMRKNAKPPFSTSRFISAIMVGYLWGQLIMLAIPEDDFGGINWNRMFHWFIPLAVALGNYFQQ
ncbi:hypothetical protein JTB14_021063 [Gonioctena quinquepunctata]|nr:hypothetical protein JTB14_021063 [Gonioctena quinquepunctata]